ncbi:hypothetical protein DRN52_05770 [Thermococci archaeon]|nr:MAG: hypothetical protein DRN52_05770 [Thermococci archaeon]
MNCETLHLCLMLSIVVVMFTFFILTIHSSMKYRFFHLMEEITDKIKKEEEEEKRKLNLRKMLKGEADLEFFSKYPELLKSVKRELISLHLLFVFFIAFALTQYICEKSTISLYFLPFYLALYPLLIVRTIKVFSLKAKGEKQEQSQE